MKIKYQFTEKQMKEIIHAIAVYGEAAFRRGFQHGVVSKASNKEALALRSKPLNRCVEPKWSDKGKLKFRSKSVLKIFDHSANGEEVLRKLKKET
mgnify:CR=1 FL=1